MIPAVPVEFWRFFDFYTIGILFVVIGLLVRTHHNKNGAALRTISQTVAYSKPSSLIFSIVMTIFFPLYYAFIWLWVGPKVYMPVVFYYLLTISAICEMIFVWVPATIGKSRKVHEAMATIVGLAMFVLPIIILVYGKYLNITDKVSILSFIILAIILGCLLVIRRLLAYTFLFETIYCLVFLITISIIAHS
jgi:hypothetical protein